MHETDNQRSALLLKADFADVEELCQSAKYWSLDLRLLNTAVSNPLIGTVQQLGSGPLVYGYCSLNGSFDQFGAAPPGNVTFVVLETGMKRLWWRGHDVNTQEILVYRVGSEVRCVSGEDFAIHTVSAEPATIGRLCECLKLSQPGFNISTETFCLPGPLLQLIRQILRGFRDQVSGPSHDDLMMILEVLLKAWLEPGQKRKCGRPAVRARDLALRKCLNYFEEYEPRNLSLNKMCSIANVIERILIYAFRKRYGLSPKAFIRWQRLAAVRQQLKRPGNFDLLIADLAAFQGFSHLSHFSEQYRRMFGETPTQTKLRSS